MNPHIGTTIAQHRSMRVALAFADRPTDTTHKHTHSTRHMLCHCLSTRQKISLYRWELTVLGERGAQQNPILLVRDIDRSALKMHNLTCSPTLAAIYALSASRAMRVTFLRANLCHLPRPESTRATFVAVAQSNLNRNEQFVHRVCFGFEYVGYIRLSTMYVCKRPRSDRFTIIAHLACKTTSILHKPFKIAHYLLCLFTVWCVAV